MGPRKKLFAKESDDDFSEEHNEIELDSEDGLSAAVWCYGHASSSAPCSHIPRLLDGRGGVLLHILYRQPDRQYKTYRFEHSSSNND